MCVLINQRLPMCLNVCFYGCVLFFSSSFIFYFKFYLAHSSNSVRMIFPEKPLSFGKIKTTSVNLILAWISLVRARANLCTFPLESRLTNRIKQAERLHLDVLFACHIGHSREFVYAKLMICLVNERY